MSGGVDFRRLKRGDVLHLHDGSRVKVLRSIPDSSVGIAAVRDDSGADTFVDESEVAGFSPVPPGPEWGESVAVVLYPVSESEETEGGFEAVTMGGVPFDVCITGAAAESSQAALDQVLGALSAFGYSGTVAVEDATYIGGTERYEVSIS